LINWNLGTKLALENILFFICSRKLESGWNFGIAFWNIGISRHPETLNSVHAWTRATTKNWHQEAGRKKTQPDFSDWVGV
jgi:hypothetical protein